MPACTVDANTTPSRNELSASTEKCLPSESHIHRKEDARRPQRTHSSSSGKGGKTIESPEIEIRKIINYVEIFRIGEKATGIAKIVDQYVTFKIFHNICLSKNLSDLIIVLSQFRDNFDVIILTESWKLHEESVPYVLYFSLWFIIMTALIEMMAR